MSRTRQSCSALLLASCCIATLPVSVAHAGGLEIAGAGARGNARGGATAAKPEDALALRNDPAGLALIGGNTMMMDFNVALFHACFDPVGYYGWGVYNVPGTFALPNARTGQTEYHTVTQDDPYYSEVLPTVCAKNDVVPIPQFGFTHRISDKLGIGYGLIFPPAQPGGSWGDRNGLIETPNGMRTAPTRFMLIDNHSIGVFPQAGIGYTPFKGLSLGLTFEWGIVMADARVMTSIGSGTRAGEGIIAHVEADDLFVPGVNGSIHLKPIDALDLVLAFRFQDNVVTAGKVTTTAGLFTSTQRPHETRLVLDQLRQNLPSQLTAALRYASKRDTVDADARVTDPLVTERWDVELDVQYQMNSTNQEQVVDLRDGQFVELMGADGSISRDNMAPLENRVPKHWKDQISVRAGGTVTLVPGVMSMSVGAHYETRGVDPNYVQIDYWPFQRVGLHTGATIRMGEDVDVTVSYAHIFQETIEVAPPPHGDRFMGGFDKSLGHAEGGRGATPPVVEEQHPFTNPDGVAAVAQQVSAPSGGQPPYIINQGRYRSSFDVLAIGFLYHF